jgi:hypothetical protein
LKGLLAACLLILLCLSASALDEGHVMYVGGTVPGVNVGTVGQLDTTSVTSLTFEFAGHKVAIPYASINSYEYTKEVSRHLGVVPAIAVGLVKKRRHRHFFRISYREPDAEQVVVLEVPKQMPPSLQAILQARMPKECRRCRHSIQGDSAQPNNDPSNGNPSSDSR